MKAEIISIGSELLLGQILDTNTAWIAKKLAESGIALVQASMVGDRLSHIIEAIQGAIGRSNLVITTGGLGPTEDDLTREAVAHVFHRPLQFQPRLMEQIEDLFRRRGFKMAENNRKQAFIPEGSIPIENPKGTAPGFIMEYPDGALISIPGVPLEMEYLMEYSVIPYLMKRFRLKNEIISYKVLRTCGLGESAIGLQIGDLMAQGRNPSVGTLASLGDIKIRITAKAESQEEAKTLINETEKEIRERLGPLIYGVDDETLQGNVMREMERRHQTLALIEGFTGGLLSHKLTSTESPSFLKGMVLPRLETMFEFLNWSSEGGISSDLAILTEQLAERARQEVRADVGLALMGKILKDQGKNEFLFETHYALATPKGTEKYNYILGGESWMVRERTTIIALDLLRKYLIRN